MIQRAAVELSTCARCKQHSLGRGPLVAGAKACTWPGAACVDAWQCQSSFQRSDLAATGTGVSRGPCCCSASLERRRGVNERLGDAHGMRGAGTQLPALLCCQLRSSPSAQGHQCLLQRHRICCPRAHGALPCGEIAAAPHGCVGNEPQSTAWHLQACTHLQASAAGEQS